MLAGMVAWPANQAPAVLAFLRDFIADAPDEVALMANLRLAPPLPLFPEPLHGKPIVALVAMYAGSPEEGERVLRPVREFGAPVVDLVTRRPYVAQQQLPNAAVPHGRHYYWKSHRLGPLTHDVIDIICSNLTAITSPMSSVPIFSFGGAMSRASEDATAFPHRDAAHDINIVGCWLPDQAADADRHVAWVRRFFDELTPHSRGVYVNFTRDVAAERVRVAYSKTQWTRLTAPKAKYDPANFFNHNANILPA